MDIAILGKISIKIRSKNASFVVDPVKTTAKTNADAVLILSSNEDLDISRVLDSRIIIDSPGEYEVSGVKISGDKREKGVIYSILIDGIKIILGKASEISKIQENVNNCDILLINVDDDLKAIIASVEPKVVILYGDKKTEAQRALGKEQILPVQKYTITKDKLPGEMGVITLG